MVPGAGLGPVPLHISGARSICRILFRLTSLALAIAAALGAPLLHAATDVDTTAVPASSPVTAGKAPLPLDEPAPSPKY